VKLSAGGGVHLTYCTNIHAGETWPEVRANVAQHVVGVKARVAPDAPFGIGLRLSAVAAEALAEPKELEAFREFLDRQGMYVFTINGFPYGPFHGTAVKEAVYLPDWMDEARLVYTDRLARLLAAILPAQPGLEGSVSTSPGAFKPRVRSGADVERMADMMIRHVATLHDIEQKTGKVVSLAIEPEPYCHMETVAETVQFFERHLFAPSAVARLSALTGLGRAGSERYLRQALGVCFDACHMAVEFEDARAALAAFATAGIRIGKFQISAGLVVRLDGDVRDTLEALQPFAEGVYLHQVVQRDGAGTLVRYLDLPEALAAAPALHGPAEWRVHFHVPLFLARLGRFANTQAYLAELLASIRTQSPSAHLEVETYTWDVLPEQYRRDPIVTAVARELEWVRQQLQA
jgi:sugar phosphate isomerase/epimerase